MLPLPPVFTWIPLPHLPHPPDHFIEKAYSIGYPDAENDMLLKDYPGHKTYKHREISYNGQVMKSRCQEAKDMGPDWAEWVKANISADYISTSVRLNVASPDDPESTIHGPHVDGRMLRLYYLLDCGGDNVVTEFYLEPGKTFIRAEHEVTQTNYSIIDELTVVDRGRFPLRQWIIFNGATLHGVMNITGRRLNFVVAIRPEHFTFDIRTNLIN